jgi:hypothetical protein
MDILEMSSPPKIESLKQVSRAISHSFQEETPEAKARWFQSLTLTERMELFCMFTDLILSVNPRIVEQKNAKPVAGRIRVLSQA